MPVRDYYAEVWDGAAASCVVATPSTHPYWHWFREVLRLPKALHQHATGVVPLNGVFLSHGALKAVASMPIPSNVFCELRLETLLDARGIEICRIPAAKGATNSFSSELTWYDSRTAGLYHPVKHLRPHDRLVNGSPRTDKTGTSCQSPWKVGIRPYLYCRGVLIGACMPSSKRPWMDRSGGDVYNFHISR